MLMTDEECVRAVKEYCNCKWVCKPSLTSLKMAERGVLSLSRRNLVVWNLQRHLDSCVIGFEKV